MKKLIIFLLLLTSILAAVLYFSRKIRQEEASLLPKETPPDLKDVSSFTVIAQELEIPWSLAFLPDGNILFTERPGRIRMIDKNGNLTLIADISEAKHIGEGGLLGMAIHPDFSQNRYIYLYYTYRGMQENTLNRVVRYQLEGNKLLNRQVIIDAIPGAANHNGGRIKFGPDGYLYITTGDAQNPSLAQDTNSLAGKILRVTNAGQPAPDNPFGNAVFSYGHRNSQGLAWDDQDRLWATEHGRSGVLSGLDELNLVEKGKNYGWPVIQGEEKREGMISPIIQSGPNIIWAPAGAAFYQNAIFFGGLRGQTLYQAQLKNGAIELKEHFQEQFGRLRDVVVGPDGYLYLTTSNRDGRGTAKSGDDKIIRVNPL